MGGGRARVEQAAGQAAGGGKRACGLPSMRSPCPPPLTSYAPDTKRITTSPYSLISLTVSWVPVAAEGGVGVQGRGEWVCRGGGSGRAREGGVGVQGRGEWACRRVNVCALRVPRP